MARFAVVHITLGVMKKRNCLGAECILSKQSILTLSIALLGASASSLAIATEKTTRPSSESPAAPTDHASAPRGSQYPTESAPLPVRIVETPHDVAHSREREAKSDKHDADDLDAQVRTASAAEEQVRINWTSLVLSLIGAVFLGWTLFETRRSASAATKAAAAAIRSVDIAETGVRPIVIPRIVSAKSVYPGIKSAAAHIPYLRFCWANYGKSPAFLREANFEIRLFSELPQGREWLKPTKRVDQTVIPGETDGDDASALRCALDRPLTEQEAQQIRAKLTEATQRSGIAARFFFIGNVVYDDVFGNTHETGFCMKIFADGTQAMRGGSAYNYSLTVRADRPTSDAEDAE